MGRTAVTRGNALGVSWEFATRMPHSALRPYVRRYCGYAERVPGSLVRREFPHPAAVLILEFGTPIRVGFDPPLPGDGYPGGFVAGVGERYAVTEYSREQRGLQVDFSPIGARLFFGLPMVELRDKVVAFRDVVAPRHKDLVAELEALPDWATRFDRVERVIGERIESARVETRIAAWAHRRIEDAGGLVEMRTLARELGYSQKHVNTVFADQIGVSPKVLARLVRFDRLMTALKSGRGLSWSALAAELGFYDQAHLIRDVRQFTGMTPSALRATVDGLPTYS